MVGPRAAVFPKVLDPIERLAEREEFVGEARTQPISAGVAPQQHVFWASGETQLGSRQRRLVSALSCSRISRQASAIDKATPLGLQALELTITSASRKRLPWGRFVSDMSDVSVTERECS